MRVAALIVVEVALVMMSETAAAKPADCEALFQAVTDARAFPTPASKLQHLRERGGHCRGTGMYESRLAYLYVQMGKTDEAVKILNDGLSTPNAHHKELKFALVNIEVARGQLDKAFENATRVKREYPDWFGGYVLLAKISLMQGRFAESIQYGTAANKLSPNPSTYLGLAIAYHQLDHDEQAVKAGLEAIRLDPTVLRAGAGINETIYSLVRLKRYSDAAELVKTRMMNDNAWRKDPVFVKVYEDLRTLVPGEFANIQVE
jgi:tetratricopeptide (TPR) repeat protein